MRALRRAVRVGGLAVLCLAPPARVMAQGVRITGSSTARFIELRTLSRDSVPSDVAPGDGLLRQLPDGRVVRCIPGESYCRDVRPGPIESTMPAIHDVSFTAWGFGRGVRLVGQVRARSMLGGNRDLWPQGEETTEVLSLYGEIERDRFRARLGRQWRTSGIGYYNFDGASFGARPMKGLWAEVWAGRSLVRGLNESRTALALEAVESLSLPNAGVLGGVQVQYRPSMRFAASAQYQIDMRGDRRGLYSELASADAVLRLWGGSAEGSIELDAATNTVNQARLSLRSKTVGRTTLLLEARRYRPYFEEWTIWGAFSPVGFDEARGGVSWTIPNGRLQLRGDASYRTYDDPGVGSSLDPISNSGWGAGTNAVWSPTRSWRFDGTYRLDAGFGAARRDAQAGAMRLFGDLATLSVQGVYFERLYEFRLGEGTVYGIGGEGSVRVGDRVRVVAQGMAYHHADAGTSDINWTQRRALVRCEWVLGRDAGARARPLEGR